MAVWTSWARAPSSCGFSNADQYGTTRSPSMVTPSSVVVPLTVERCPMAAQSSSMVTPGASRSTNASTRRSAGSSALTASHRDVMAPVQ
ncbi:hypothetical protein MMUC44124_09985 [Mycolicibacterium mucogenicum DSM 44124]|nr:hypothetical protein MMUC44124_09985 [Mycolicibacterium mucogenicum DSM 44124]